MCIYFMDNLLFVLINPVTQSHNYLSHTAAAPFIALCWSCQLLDMQFKIPPERESDL